MRGRIPNMFILIILALLVSISCEHRELLDPQGMHYIRIYLDEDIRNVTYGFYNPDLERPEYKSPQVFRAVLASPETGRIVSEKYLSNSGEDERGRYIDGYMPAMAGTYDFLAYQMGSVVTLVENADNYNTMRAYTKQISSRLMEYLPATRQNIDEGHIVNQPDLFFHSAHRGIKVRNNTYIDTLLTAEGDYFTAHSMVQSYYIQVRVSGFEYIRSAVSLLGGLAGSSKISGHGEFEMSDSVYVFFGMKYTGKERHAASETTTATLYATFNTFGKLPDAKNVYAICFEFSLSDGSTQMERIDITDMFDTPIVRDKQWILLEDEILIKPPEGADKGGGLNPGVDDWEDVQAEITM